MNHVVCVAQAGLPIGLRGEDPLDLSGFEAVSGGGAACGRSSTGSTGTATSISGSML